MTRICANLTKFIIPMVLMIGIVAYTFRRAAGKAPPPMITMEQLAARARILPMPATDLVNAPLATTWEMPMGTRAGGFIYNAQHFLEPNPGRGGLHLGDDLNGIGQENTDLNDPVFAPANGLVAYAGEASPGWGGVVILLHRTDAGVRHSLFGHLDPDSIAVEPGDIVPRGHPLGRLALTTAVDYAHLHFEIRRGATADPGAGYSPEGGLLSEDAVGFVKKRMGIPGLPTVSEIRESR